MRKFGIAVTFLMAAACGSGTPPAPSPGPGTGGTQSITGRERIGWDQSAASRAELETFRYAIYVDGVRSEVADSSCAATESSGGYPCSGKLPPIANGAHTLELATFIASDGDIVESPRSSPLAVTVAALTAAAPEWGRGELETTRDGVTLRADKIADGLDRPVDAAFVAEGRLLIAERPGRIRMVADGQIQSPDALVLPREADAASPSLLSIAVDPEFARTRFVFVLHTADTANGPVFRLSRYRELSGRLAERAILFEAAAPLEGDPSAVVRFGPDGKLYLALSGTGSDGRLLRLNADGTMPRDQAGTTPALAAGIAIPRGLGWDPQSGLLWIADDDGDAGHVSGVSLSAPPVRATVRGRSALRSGIGRLVFYDNDAMPALRHDALIASNEGMILRVRFASDDPTRVERAGRLLENRAGPIFAVTVASDGAIYFCTDTALGRLVPVQP